MASLEELNVYLASNAYIGSPVCATREDYERCQKIQAAAIDATKFSHVYRWHCHISYLSAKFGSFDSYGNQIQHAASAGAPSCSPRQSTQQRQPKLEQKQKQAAQEIPSSTSGCRYVAVLDFEKSLKEIVEDRSQMDKTFPCEIIEFPTVLVDLATGDIIDEVATIVKPKLQPQITEATTRLTSITQEEIDTEGVSFGEAFSRWHSKMVEWRAYSPILATCGNMDIQTSLPQQLEHEMVAAKAGNSDAMRAAECFRMLREVGAHRWCNIKEYFMAVLGANWEERLPWFDEGKGIRQRLTQESMLEALHIQAKGQHHRGIDDCRNLAALMVSLYKESSNNMLPQTTGELKERSVKALKM